MSKRNDRREAERAARKLAYQLRQGAAASQSSKIISEAQLAANQANARLSHGPATPEGIAVSSRNHTSHGLTSVNDGTGGDDFRVLASENQNDYNRDLADFRAEWKPKTATERDLVHRLATHQWLRRRALRMQEALFHPQTGELTDTRKFDLFRRYETAHERSFNKALADMMRLRAFQLRQQNGFESQARKNEEHQLKMQRLKNREEHFLAAQQAKSNRKATPGVQSNPPEVLQTAA